MINLSRGCLFYCIIIFLLATKKQFLKRCVRLFKYPIPYQNTLRFRLHFLIQCLLCCLENNYFPSLILPLCLLVSSQYCYNCEPTLHPFIYLFFFYQCGLMNPFFVFKVYNLLLILGLNLSLFGQWNLFKLARLSV